MSATPLTERDWAIRTAIYQFFVEYARAPSCAETASEFSMEVDEVQKAYRRLHNAHAIFLDPGTDRIRLLNPFSNVPTPFQVRIGDITYYANCAWDMLAIPAMIDRDAMISARLEVADTTVQIPVEGGEPLPDRDYVVNYSVPFRKWYADLIYT